MKNKRHRGGDIVLGTVLVSYAVMMGGAYIAARVLRDMLVTVM